VVAEAHAVAIRDQAGALSGYVIVNRDVTERTRAEEALRASEAQLAFADRMASMGTLAAGVAHEINNPLSCILANIDYVRHQLSERVPPSPDLLQALEETREGVARVREIVHDLRPSRESTTRSASWSTLAGVLRASLNLTQNEIRRRGRLVLDVRDVPAVRASSHGLGQVFVNLLVNAAQALPDGDPDRQQIRVSAWSEGGGTVAVEVSDTGPGIPREHLERIFEPFFTTKPVGVGTGLGLSICHGIVTRLGGEIRVDSPATGGARFRVLLPAAGDHDGMARKTVAT
jgi:C4-dicarboxylate-specific signal transduction histidine kinase